MSCALHVGSWRTTVFPGDVIVGDMDAVIVIPAHLCEEVTREAVDMTAYEDFVAEHVRNGESIIGLYPPTDERNLERFSAWRNERSR